MLIGNNRYHTKRYFEVYEARFFCFSVYQCASFLTGCYKITMLAYIIVSVDDAYCDLGVS